jgi:branched-chain amino acid transport system ATP-binding protein
MPELLDVAELDVSYAGVAAVQGVSLTVAAGEIVGLVGPNGAGKSTTLHAIMGMVAAERGEVRLAGQSLRGLPPERIARAGIALVPEGRRIYADFTVEENLRLGLVGRPDCDRAAPDLDWIRELFPVVDEYRRRQAGSLSGGQQQQLAIARALAAGPKVLLLDEPSLGLAPKVVDVVFETLGVIRDRGVAVLLVEQRAQRTVALADRTHVLTQGQLRMTLTPKDAADTERLVAAYLA